MPGPVIVSVYDDEHKHPANGIKYDLWQINDGNGRVQLKQGTFDEKSAPNVLLETDQAYPPGFFEIVLYTKDYFEKINKDLVLNDSRLTLSFGTNGNDHGLFLSINITPTGCSMTL